MFARPGLPCLAYGSVRPFAGGISHFSGVFPFGARQGNDFSGLLEPVITTQEDACVALSGNVSRLFATIRPNGGQEASWNPV
jgi:hypothetical protein